MAEEIQKPKTKYLEARIRANEKWNKKTYWQTLIRFPKAMEQEIRNNAGDSINSFVVNAVKEKLERIKQDE